MREILFRGQTRRFGEKLKNMRGDPMPSNWVYGGIFPQNKGGNKAIIYQQDPEIKKYVVYADTVGQYTGLKDKNGVKIFEGDIVIGKKGYAGSPYYPIWEQRFTVNFEYGCYRELCDTDYYEFEVIGNIHDNPELIKGE